MYYGKLEELFDEVCKATSINKEEWKQQMVKEFIEKNKNHISEKYYLKYYGDKEEFMIFGDDGQFYELSDGSKMKKRTFEKMFSNNKTGEIEINPYDFWNYKSLNIKTFRKVTEKPIDPVDPTEFNNSYLEFAKKIQNFFKDIDTKNMKEEGKSHVNIKTPIWNNESNIHNQNDEWGKKKPSQEELIEKWKNERTRDKKENKNDGKRKK